ncbi:MAG: hypothetical protein SPJ27_02620 [Candidatus Onthovivens sp.]|nr:hypothetical protein [Candidatus Onthovivens sp.]
MADKFIKSITFVKGGDVYYPLPKVTNADNGKVLKVVNGAWGFDENPKNLVKIEVTTSPTTVNYTEDDALDLTGLVVTATFDDGSTEDVTTWCIFSPASGTILAATDTRIGISYTYKGVMRNTSQIIVVEPAVLPYLRFIGNEDFTLKTYNTTKNWDGTLEYSTDTSTWNTWNGTEISSSGSKLYLRGTGNTRITDNSTNYRFVFTGAGTLKIACVGNIENLLDYETVSAGGHPTMADFCYCEMFGGCTSLTTAPALPATTLANYCYAYMFDGCISLTTAPALPATRLDVSCYSDMFRGCTALTTAPALPATTLAHFCYCEMFGGCTSLTTAPALPATTLASYCYAYMFDGCISLTTAPALPATRLDVSCYSDMFRGCTNIKLSTTQTGEYQTAYRIPKSGTGTDAANALANMFGNTGGTFTDTPSINTTYYTSNTVV